MDGEEGVDDAVEKEVSARVRAAGGRCPCKEYRTVDDGNREGSI